MDLHPDRQAMLDAPEPEQQQSKPKSNYKPKSGPSQNRQDGGRNRKPKRSAFSKELEIAEKRKKEAEKRREEKEFKQKDREAMARARRPDQFGKRRLGRESQVLLGRVQRMVG